jgi:NADH-quinone oxidoreductase subunit L
MSNLSTIDIALGGIVAAPFIGFLLNGLLGRNLSKSLSALIGCGAIGISFALSLLLMAQHLGGAFESHTTTLFEWIPMGTSNINFSLLADPLSLIMLLVITGVGSLIHIYSAGYMHDDEGFYKFFAYMNLFVFSMLLLVLGSNFVMMFAGWEGVGLCSFLLIGFWFKNADYNAAAKKAFVMNRIGDLGFLLGMFLILVNFGSLNYADIFANNSFAINDPTLIAITLLLFVGAAGKSAQIPLYTWLPDAMAGPTPVSALIHAATMVTAGVYMIGRCGSLYSAAPFTAHIIAIIGMATALLAATIAVYQNDIKKILAYSTVSQLGYMFVAMGLGAYTAGIFHLVTHAFFKALLFLGAGAVIHALHGEQDIRKMGGLKDQIPTTYRVMLIGTLAIAGLPPLSGFFSKDEILLHAFEQNKILWIFAVIGSLLTTFYMFRMLMLTFWGEYRGNKHTLEHLHHNPASMNIPLVVLAVLSVVGGFIGLPHFLGGSWLHHFLAPVFGQTENILHVEPTTEMGLMAFMVALVGALIYYVTTRYNAQQANDWVTENTEAKLYKRLPAHKYYVDELYDGLIVRPLNAFSQFAHRILDVEFFDGIVNGIGSAAVGFGALARRLQTGDVSFYLFIMVLGAMAAMAWGLIF